MSQQTKKKKNDSSQVDLLDITRGYSILSLEDKKYYFRHPTVLQTLENESLFFSDIEESAKSGIKTEEEILSRAIELGSWSKAEGEKIESLKWMLKKSITALSKIEDPKQRELFNKQIKDQEKELQDIKDKRSKLVEFSAEHLAGVKKTKRILTNCLFKDKEFTEGLDNLNVVAALLFASYARFLSKETILNASFHGGFFDLYVPQNSNPLALFGKTFYDITLFQKSLISLSSSLLNKMKNTKIPDEIYGDPLKMLEYEEKEEKDSKVSHGVGDLKAKMAMRGGKLKAEDFLS
tara:strand:+ start:7222 stop:8100 length:879 start_codon:yes stop_codon:yes gene_type:complete